jgi:hypothetical protein
MRSLHISPPHFPVRKRTHGLRTYPHGAGSVPGRKPLELSQSRRDSLQFVNQYPEWRCHVKRLRIAQSLLRLRLDHPAVPFDLALRHRLLQLVDSRRGDFRLLQDELREVLAILEVGQPHITHVDAAQIKAREALAGFEMGQPHVGHLRTVKTQCREVLAILARPRDFKKLIADLETKSPPKTQRAPPPREVKS